MGPTIGFILAVVVAVIAWPCGLLVSTHQAPGRWSRRSLGLHAGRLLCCCSNGRDAAQAREAGRCMVTLGYGVDQVSQSNSTTKQQHPENGRIAQVWCCSRSLAERLFSAPVNIWQACSAAVPF